MALSPRFRLKIFQTAFIAVFISFVGLMIVVGYTATSIQSGRTNIDVAKLPEIRAQTTLTKGTVKEAREGRLVIAQKKNNEEFFSIP